MNTIVLTPVEGSDRDRDCGAVPSPELRELVIATVAAALAREIREEVERERSANSNQVVAEQMTAG